MHAKLTREQNLDLYYFMRLNRQLEDRLVACSARTKLSAAFIPASARKRFRSARPMRSNLATGWPR